MNLKQVSVYLDFEFGKAFKTTCFDLFSIYAYWSIALTRVYINMHLWQFGYIVASQVVNIRVFLLFCVQNVEFF